MTLSSLQLVQTTVGEQFMHRAMLGLTIAEEMFHRKFGTWYILRVY